MHKKNTAIDIVLLPPDDIMDVAIELNDKLQSANKTELNKVSYYPHISLLMGSVDDDRFEELTKIVEGVAKQFSGLDLEADFVSNEYSALMIPVTDQLERLQQVILRQTMGLVVAEVTQDSLADLDVDAQWVAYMNGYREHDTGKNFNPHITLGRGENSALSAHVAFTADRLVIGRLGDRCTVREILFDTPLTSL